MMRIRNVTDVDYLKVREVINDWWGGREITHLLHRYLFQHFQQTSFIVENELGKLTAFIIGFVSQTNTNEAYIHLIAVDPKSRKIGIAQKLYELFFEKVRALGCDTVRCITAPSNKGSIEFHKSMGFSYKLVENYSEIGQDRILFTKHIT